MPNELPRIEVIPTLEFKRDLRALAKKYRHVRSDVDPLIERLQAGELIGDKIPGIGYEVFKARIKNSDAQKGKSGGYRVIYYLKTSVSIVLISIYSKSEQSDISAERLREIVADFNEISPEDYNQKRGENHEN